MSFTIGRQSLRPRENQSLEDGGQTDHEKSSKLQPGEYTEDDTVNLSLSDQGLDNYLLENGHLFRQTSGTLRSSDMGKNDKKHDSSEEEKVSSSSSSEEETEETDPMQNAIVKMSKKLNRKLQMGGGTSIALEHFDIKQHKPASWFKKFRKFCQFKRMNTKAACRLFPLVVKDDDVAAWIEEIPTESKDSLEELEKAFLTEFGPENVALYDEKAALHSLKQGRDSAKTFIRKVMARIRELYKVEPTEDLSDPHRQVAQTVLMQGLSSPIRAQLALQGCSELEDIIRVAKLADEANRDAGMDNTTVREMVGSITERFYEAVQPCLQKITKGVDTINNNSVAVVNGPSLPKPSGQSGTPSWYRNRTFTPPADSSDKAQPRTGGQQFGRPARRRVHFQTFGKAESGPFNGTCFICNRWGHKAMECPNRYHHENVGYNFEARVQCQLCKTFGHDASQCQQFARGQPNSRW